MQHKEILELLGRFFKEQNIDIIRPYLHSNITYYTDGMCGEAIDMNKNDGRYPDVLFGVQEFVKHFEYKFHGRINPLDVTGHYIYPLENKGRRFVLLKGKEKRTRYLLDVKFKNAKILYLYMCNPKTSLDFHRAQSAELNIRMFKAAMKLNWDEVFRCIKKGAHMNAMNENGETENPGEGAFADIQLAISKKLSEQGYDGVIFYETENDNVLLKEAFVFMPQISKAY